MNSFSIFNIFKIFGIVSTWATKAIADGKVTMEEAVELATVLADILDVRIEINIPDGLMPADNIRSITPEDSTNLSPPEAIIKKGLVGD